MMMVCIMMMIFESGIPLLKHGVHQLPNANNMNSFLLSNSILPPYFVVVLYLVFAKKNQNEIIIAFGINSCNSRR